MNVVVFTPALVAGDAVSNDVLGMVAALERAGHRAYPAARWILNEIKAATLEEIPNLLTEPDDVLIYHHSIGLDDAVRMYESLPCRKIVKYHNVTPAHFFEGINKEVVRACREGLEQLSRLIPTCAAFWADSEFNGHDMQARHPEQDFDVLPPFNQVEELIAAEPDLTTVAQYDDWLTNILVVGRIVPNKNNMLAVEAFAEYRARHDPLSRLIFVGDVGQNFYCDKVIQRIRDLRMSRNVCMTGKISLRQLKTLYQTAQMLLTTSSHEGFCLPILEGMGLRVPLVALPNAAIPGTAGESAWYASESAETIADVMNHVRQNPRGREEKLNLGRERYLDHFRNEAIERRFLDPFATASESCLAIHPPEAKKTP